jgi:hypothetical protein
MGMTSGIRTLQIYYLATPLFWLIDLWWSADLRVAALDAWPTAKTLYYLACCGLAVLGVAAPRLTCLAGLLESSVNILLLLTSLLATYLATLESAAVGSLTDSPLTLSKMANFLVVGTMLAISFYANPLLTRGLRPHS